MKTNQTHQNPSILSLFKLFNPPSNLISFILFFAFGLCSGIIFTSQFKYISFNFQFPQFSFSGDNSGDISGAGACVSGGGNLAAPSPQAPPLSRVKVGLKSYLTPPEIIHDMTDEELIWRASMVAKVREYPFERTPKVAFMFLVRGPVVLAPLWEGFFKGYNGLFTIYVHGSNRSLNVTEPEGSVFHGRRVPSKGVEWGKVNMIEAERRLLANALLDYLNQRFVLLSEACIPLFNFSTVYSYLINSKYNFVESYDLAGPVGRDRYSKKMAPVVDIKEWRKGSQYMRNDVTEKLRNNRRSCEYNGKKNQICYLFARKFSPHALDRLLRIAPKLMQFNL
ncbi:uncharacterized protein LOC143594197 [Bidens hawaiensis]|uniref:uncharacterized protein LOC143594197 n=1 Tax=Bidens hawaiensis TaxID=980011 RepID=UPI00404B5A73